MARLSSSSPLCCRFSCSIVIGVFEFGRAITYWHDLNNTAQVAARYAVVNRYPGCPGTAVPEQLSRLGEDRSQLRGSGERPEHVVTICYQDDTSNNVANAGDPVTVTITSDFKPAPFLKLANITLRGKATLRLEQNTRPISGLHERGCAMHMRNRPRVQARDERGQILILTAATIIALLFMGTVVVDVGNWFIHRRHLQTQVDAAALAAARTSQAASWPTSRARTPTSQHRRSCTQAT